MPNIFKSKRLFSAAAVALIASAIAPAAAFANVPDTGYSEIDGTGQFTVNGLKEGATVTYKRVVSTVVAKDGTAHTFWTGVESVDGVDLANAKDQLNGNQVNANKVAVAYQDADATGTATDGAESDEKDGSVTVSGLKAGLYLVTVSDGDDATTVYQNTLIPVNPTADNDGWNKNFGKGETVAIKSSATGLDKYIYEDDADKDATKTQIDTLSTNDTAKFRLDVTVPTYVEGATDRTFTITDTLVKDYLDIANFDANGVTVDTGSKDVTLEKGDAKDAKDYTVSYNEESGRLTVDFTNDGLAKLNKAGITKVTVRYAAKVIYKTAARDYQDVNGAVLTFSKNSVDDTTKTDDGKTQAKFYGLKIVKIGENNKQTLLKGAVFDVYKGSVADANKVGTLNTDENGAANLDGQFVLGNGETYVLKEIKAPAGYQLAADTTVTVSATGDKANVEAGYVTATISDAKDTGFNLPQTGGAGTVALTVAGVAIMGGAAVLLVRSRKEN